ncbi:predicted protein [Nematostella vectensis]|uniref:Amino acid transporter transmembrane domain-containing protein n=1 Tax=Nematostella vectensis TaxID=45351 RepID=A7S4J3_NEMVE|nr:predicted protein [Nematostella vectensis]|eukprot:XP_001633352.1 predicted protein [Nematostella vectensis]
MTYIESTKAKINRGYTAVPGDGKEKAIHSNEARQERDVNDGTTSTWRATLNTINYMEGSGFVALPYAVARGGLAGALGFILVPIIFTYTAHIMVDCLYEGGRYTEKKRVRSSYEEIATAVWPPAGYMLNTLFVFSFFDHLTSYNLVSSSLLAGLQTPGVDISQRYWSIIIGAVVLPTLFIKTFRSIAWLSLLATAALLLALLTVIVYDFHNYKSWDFNSLLFWDLQGFLLAINISAFSNGIHASVISFEKSMLHKSQFSLALAISYTSTCIIKTAFAVLGFLAFKANTSEVVILNIPQGTMRTVVTITTVVSTMSGYPLVVQLLISIIEKRKIGEFLSARLSPLAFFVISRVAIVVITTLAAICIPHFALWTSLGGSVVSYALSLFFPAALHLGLRLDQGLPTWQLLADWFCVVFAMAGSVLGVYSAVKAIVLQAF